MSEIKRSTEKRFPRGGPAGLERLGRPSLTSTVFHKGALLIPPPLTLDPVLLSEKLCYLMSLFLSLIVVKDM